MNSISTSDTTSNGNNINKARDYGGQSTRVADPLVHVQPPRREDLQPSYASVLKPDTEDASQHGWYGRLMRALIATL